MTSRGFSALLPVALAEHLRSGPETGAAWIDRRPAVILFADIAGFTALSERLAQQGSRAGAEALSRMLNLCFGRAVEIVMQHGGDVLRFAGDAPIVLFRPERDADPEAMVHAVERAAACGLALQATMEDVRQREGVALAIRIGLGAGDAVAMAVGGVERRREFLVGGPCVTSAVAALEGAAPGDVVLAQDVVPNMPSPGSLEKDVLAGGAWRIRAAPCAPPRVARAIPVVEPAALRPFIPRSVLARLDSGQADWVAELRRVTVLFLSLRGLDLAADDAGETFQTAFTAVQAAIYGAEGSINQFLVDDKGVTVLAAWGVPGRTHEDDAARAVRAAEDARARLHALGVDCGAGLASGRAFCGWRGNEARREFALIGTVVSLAARLAAHAGPGMLCDRATRESAGKNLAFDSAGTLTVKGVEAAVPVFRPAARGASRPVPVDETGAAAPAPFVGREAERASIEQALSRVSQGTGTTLLFEGDAGVGKSSLIAHAIQRARESGVTVLTGAGHSVAASEPYHAWRGPLEDLLHLPARACEADRLVAFADRVASDPAVGDRAPLVAAPLGLAVPNTPLTAAMTDALRLENTRDLVVRLLQREAEAGPLMLVLDDAQWLDSASWGIALAAHRRVSGLILVIGARPSGEEPAPEREEIARARRTTVCTLDHLTDKETIELACRLLDVDLLPSPVAALLRSRTGGHPLFVTELTRALRDGGLIVVEGRVGRLARDAHVLDLQQFPETVQDVVAGRLDRLTPAAQLTVKVASVLGPAFGVRALHEVHPVEHDARAILEHLAQLENAGVLTRDADGAEARYAFRHSVVHEVAYGLLVSSQRRELHQAVAEWYERAAFDPAPHAVLAHHWTRAEAPGRALAALEQAGTRASDAGAVRETIRFFQQALDLTETHRLTIDPLRRARWLCELGQAHVTNSAPDRGRAALDAALGLVGRPLPRARARLAGRFAWEALRQVAHLIAPGRPREDGPHRERRILEATILGNIGSQSFFTQDQLAMFASVLAAINAAERTEITDTTAGMYAGGGYIMSMLGLEGVARRWWRRAEQSASPRTRSHAFLSQAMHAVDVTRWDEAERLARQAFALAEGAGAHLDVNNALTALMFAQSNRGDVDAGIATARAALAVAQTADLEHRQIWGHHAIATQLLAKEEHAEAWLHTRQAIDLMADVTDPLTVATHLSHRIEFCLVAGQLEEAEHFAAELLAAIRRHPPSVMGSFNIYYWLLEFYLTKWEHDASEGRDTGDARRSARDIHGKLSEYARLFPIARPAQSRLGARIHALDGSVRRARALLRRSTARAARAGMPIAEGQACAALGQLEPAGSPERSNALERARSLFAAAGHLRAQHRVDSILAGSREPGIL